MDTKKISVLFPIMVSILPAVAIYEQSFECLPLQLVVMMGIRKLLEFVFTEGELRILDDILPSTKRKEQLDNEDQKVL